jgi:hypothetical protein
MIKILEIFTKEYREETAYREMLKSILNNSSQIKLKCGNYDVDAKIKILKDMENNDG